MPDVLRHHLKLGPVDVYTSDSSYWSFGFTARPQFYWVRNGDMFYKGPFLSLNDLIKDFERELGINVELKNVVYVDFKYRKRIDLKSTEK